MFPGTAVSKEAGSLVVLKRCMAYTLQCLFLEDLKERKNKNKEKKAKARDRKRTVEGFSEIHGVLRLMPRKVRSADSLGSY